MPKLNIPNINLIWIVYSSKKKKKNPVFMFKITCTCNLSQSALPPPLKKKGGGNCLAFQQLKH